MLNDKKRFAKSLIKSVTENIISKLKDTPSNWDGFEIRHLIAKYFEQEDVLERKMKYESKIYRKRLKDCKNTMIVNNLY